MKVEIPRITLNIFDIIGNEEKEAELYRQESTFISAWAGVYNSIAGGAHKIAYWDACRVEKTGYNSFMRYALHRSTKRDGFLQLSVMEIRNGDIIPTADSQHGRIEDFINRRAWGCGADIVTIL